MLYSNNKNYGVETIIPIVEQLKKPTSDKNYLYFQSVENGATVSLKCPSQFNTSLEISLDGENWNVWDFERGGGYDIFNKITLQNCGDYMFVRATIENVWNSTAFLYSYFVFNSKKIACGGNIMSLLYNNPDGRLSLADNRYIFYSLFYGCTSLTTAPELPATTLAQYCYQYMFSDCTSLIAVPELPATTLQESCYANMFQGCTSLTKAPELPATTLAKYCYVNMFQNCKNLTTAPSVLPATTLAQYCYQYMFNGCTSLTTAPELPATNVAGNCYEYMFQGCTSLTTAPELPATTLQNSCYQYMFQNCINLITGPSVLPATNLTNAGYCYDSMFNGCTSLTTAPKLPATILGSSSYRSMFKGCSNLRVAPKLPAITLTSECYRQMFYGCTSLTTGSDMQKARILNSSCCNQMYYGCKNLTSACTPNVSSWTDSYFTNWLYNVASAGTLYKPSNLTNISTSSANGVPTGWNTAAFSQTVTLSASGSNTYGFSYSVDGVSYTLANGQTKQVALTHPQGITITTTNQTDYIEVDGTFKQFGTTVELTYEDLSNGSVISCGHISDINLLSFTAQEAGSTIWVQHNGTNTGTTKPSIYISTDNKNTFTLWDYSMITLSNVGDTVYFYGTNPNGIARNTSNFSQFTMSGKISANGNCTTLINPNGATSIPFYGMYKLFYNCTSLTTAPELPATTLVGNCYYQMFYGCTSLTTAPELPATTLATNCYDSMFQGCTSLTTAPELPATTLASYCYQNMFQGCTKLNYIKVGATSWNTSNASNWVTNVASSGIFVKPQGTEIPYGTNGIPEEWYVTDSETKTITLSAVESDCYGFSYKLNNGSVQSLSDGQTSEITITPQDTLEIMTNDANNFRCVFLGDNVVGFGSGCTIGMTDMYYGDTITCKDPTFDKCLEFKAVSASTTIGMSHNGTNTGATKPTIYVSEGSKTNWRLWDYSNITLTNVDDTVYMFGCNRSGLSNSTSNYSYFSTNKNVLLSGSLNSLINVIGNDDFLKSYAFYYLFKNTKIITAPELPATTLANYCYQNMFNGCTSLTTAPELPATALASYCYNTMFQGCISLINVPLELPATALTSFCYSNMFNGCTSLTTAPSLPATTLAVNCYQTMFQGCTGLTTAPELPATALTSYCYYSMFQGCISLINVPSELPATNLTNATQCYYSMFYRCTSLTTAPALPAKTLESNCYSRMFQGCTSLTTAPELPATTLTSSCYQQMFQGCTSLIKVPELPATNLTNASNCYNSMFKECTSLATAPELPATTLGNNCYDSMFQGCTSLTTEPELSAMTLKTACYQSMFKGCTSLTTAPELPATTLVTSCYSDMFYECTSLNYIKVGATSWNTSYASNWVSNVASAGTFVKNESVTIPTDSVNGVPSGWSLINNTEMFSFQAGNTTSSIKLTTPSAMTISLEKSSDGTNWTTWNRGSDGVFDTINLESGETVYIRGDNERFATGTASTAYSTFSFTGDTYCQGNIMYLLDKTGQLNSLNGKNYCFDGLFSGATSLVTPPELPATTLAAHCYRGMFQGCTSLTTAPELPATTLASSCYRSMFYGCRSLTTAPELPATTLVSSCYYGMFQDCTSLTTAPSVLPATTLAVNCYASMFYGCTSLTTTPAILPATNLTNAGNCYFGMFQGCTGLTTAPALPATTLAGSCYQSMFQGCTSLTTAPELPATTLASSCYNQMFQGCTSLTTAPELPATTLAQNCYYQMFYRCTSLNYIKVGATSWNTSYASNWVSNVSSTGDFYKPEETTIDSGVNGIPNNWTVHDI